MAAAKMKRTNKVTLCALMASLSVVMMLGAWFPYLTYTIPAFAGLCIMVILLEIGSVWAISAYITSALLTVLFCEPEAMLMYVFLFGYYPILKAFIEKIKNHEIDAITFTSPLTVENFFTIGEDTQKISELLNENLLTVSIGPITAKVLDKYGIANIYPDTYTVPDMMELLFKTWREINE